MAPNDSEPAQKRIDKACDRVEPAYFADGSKHIRKDNRGYIHAYVFDNLSCPAAFLPNACLTEWPEVTTLTPL
ncbi:MAG: hypothetical protein SVV80_08810 [Planctomycetota bacterium]|nr:hypothetical protein [Planctomycetota bacterium]